jgi:hypothetical protein
MMNDPRFTPPTTPKSAIVHPIRRDGKHIVEFVFPVSGRRLRKLVLAADLKTATEGYAVHVASYNRYR